MSVLVPLEMETAGDTFLRYANCGAKVVGNMWAVVKKWIFAPINNVAGCVNVLLPNLLYRNECWLFKKKYKSNLDVHSRNCLFKTL